jgi:hypothetical protein
MKRKKIVKVDPGTKVDIDKDTEIVGLSLGQIPSEFIAMLQDGESFKLDGSTVDPEKITPVAPVAREFEARPCSSCQAIRPHGTNYSRVYCTRGNIRYCKCHFCNHTWAQEGK